MVTSMHRYLLLLLAVLSLAPIGSSQSAKPQTSEEVNLDSVHPGQISGGIYSSPYFGFSLEIPLGWKVLDNSALQALKKRNDELLRQQPQLGRYSSNGEVDSPLLAMIEREPSKDGQHHGLVQIQCTDVSGRPGQPAADEFLKFVAEASLRVDPSFEYSSTLEPVTFGGREFWKIRFTQKSSILWHGERLATIAKKHVLQFVLLSPDEGGLPRLEAILRSLRFDEQIR